MEYLAVNARELEILKAALEEDIIQQKKVSNAGKKEWLKYLAETEALLKKVTLKIHAIQAKRFERDEE